jgi:thiosulfate dehydrogenase
MFKAFVIGVVATVLVGVGLALAAVFTGRVPANADARPSKLEQWAARKSLHATIAREAPQGPGPLAASDENLKAGVDVYAHNCVFCHGAADGKASHVAEGLYQRAPQLAKHGVEDDPIGVTWWKVDHGIRWTGMPSFTKSLSQDQVWQVSLFLKHMDSLPPSVQQAWEQVPSASGL